MAKPVTTLIDELYDWTGEHHPFEHQKKTAAFLSEHKKGFCFNEQGTGKTASAIWAADFLIANIHRVLVIPPVNHGCA